MTAQIAELFAIGLVASVIGALAGLGGGFLAVPMLRIVFDTAPAETAAISLVMVLANALSASATYFRHGRIDVGLALGVAITAVPAGVLGALAVAHVPARGFDAVYGLLLLYLTVDTIRKRNRPAQTPSASTNARHLRRTVDADGAVYAYAVPRTVMLATGAGIGFGSSFFGIGGGIVFVPVMLNMLALPVQIVTATSTFTIALSAPAGILTHVLAGNIAWRLALPLAAGGLAGGLVGAQLARRVAPAALVTIIAAALIAAMIALLARHVLPAR